MHGWVELWPATDNKKKKNNKKPIRIYPLLHSRRKVRWLWIIKVMQTLM